MLEEGSQIRTVFVGEVTAAGELRLDTNDSMRWRARLLNLAGRRVRLTLAREKSRRSLQQNRYLWGVVYALLAEWSGHTTDEIHQAMKLKFLSAGIGLPTGEALETIRSTARLTIEEFSAYVESVRAFAAECGLSIPDAGEVEVAL